MALHPFADPLDIVSQFTKAKAKEPVMAKVTKKVSQPYSPHKGVFALCKLEVKYDPATDQELPDCPCRVPLKVGTSMICERSSFPDKRQLHYCRDENGQDKCQYGSRHKFTLLIID